MLETKQKRIRRHGRIRAKISGTKEKPRLCVFRSNRHIYAQLINDAKGTVLVSVSDLELTKGKTVKASAQEVGKLIAKKAQAEKIEKVVFDRGGYKYHGLIKALADGAREEGLKF